MRSRNAYVRRTCNMIATTLFISYSLFLIPCALIDYGRIYSLIIYGLDSGLERGVSSYRDNLLVKKVN